MFLQEEERKSLQAYLKLTWAAMNEQQRRNVLVAWAGIKQEEKDTLINDHLAAIEAQQRLVQNPEGSETTARSPNTTAMILPESFIF